MIKGYITQHWRPIVLGFLAFLVFSPYLLNPQYSLLDDPWYYAHALDPAGAATLLQDRAIGFTVFFYDAVFRLADFQVGGVMMLRFLELLLLVFLIYRLIRFLGGSENGAFLGGIFFLLAPPLITNFYELETQDHISLLLLLVFFFAYSALIRKREALWGRKIILAVCALASLVLFFLTKETNIFLIPVFLILAGLDWRKKDHYGMSINLAALMVGLIWLAVFFLFLRSADTSGYSLYNIMATAKGYAVILNFNILLALFLAYHLFWDKIAYWRADGEESYFKSFWLLVAIFGFIIYLPWSAAADRYLFVPIVSFFIVFFAEIPLSINKKLLYSLLALALLSNIFFAYFHAVRFYGQRVGDSNLMNYLEERADSYDRICAAMPKGSLEDLTEIDIWVNVIRGLDKEVCTVFPAGALDESGLFFLERQDISYGSFIPAGGRTIAISKDYSGIEVYDLNLDETWVLSETLEYRIFNIHPTRGPEWKNFTWRIWEK